MILLDTNVLSALMRETPDPVVVDWLDSEPAESIWTTSITVFEKRTGIELLEKGAAAIWTAALRNCSPMISMAASRPSIRQPIWPQERSPMSSNGPTGP